MYVSDVTKATRDVLTIPWTGTEMYRHSYCTSNGFCFVRDDACV